MWSLCGVTRVDIPVSLAGLGEPAATSHPFWGRAFRPFFLLGCVQAAFLVPLWTAMWRGAVPAPAWLTPPWWHAHEMLFGFVAAAIAGFLLTAAPVWTGRPALTGAPLAALVALWVAGRAAMLAAGVLPPALVALVDGAFLPAVALVVTRTVWRTGQVRNYGVVAMVMVLAATNLAVHAQALDLADASAARGLRCALDLVTALVVVIGGRITPAFTANAFLRAGIDAEVRGWRWLDRLAVATAVLVVVGDLVAPGTAASGVLAGAAALAVGARLAGWRSLRTWRDPLVWSLHAGMAWVVVGYLLVAASNLGAAIAPSAGVHALTAGAMGAMIMAVVTRVSLGHTGRPLVLPRGAAAAYGLVHAGALLRVCAAIHAGAAGTLLVAGGLVWAAAFAVFVWVYAPILVSARADGKPG
ncbi:MAG: NnrS family protein [Deltaproteobacteria bacterium]|nr:NnrS family protein [Deltaproteobacteria bacterium]